MDHKYLAIYIHDHLAGSSGALELIRWMESSNFSSAVTDLLGELRQEISSEREQLQIIAAKLPLLTSATRSAGSWIAAKSLELKLSIEGLQEAEFRLFEGLEALSVGIAGKRLLWKTLSRASQRYEILDGPDYQKLIKQSVRQRTMVEPFRLRASRVL